MVTPGVIPSVLQLGVGLPDCTRILVFPLFHAICVTSSLLTVQVSVKGSPSVPTGVTGVKIGWPTVPENVTKQKTFKLKWI